MLRRSASSLVAMMFMVSCVSKPKEAPSEDSGTENPPDASQDANPSDSAPGFDSSETSPGEDAGSDAPESEPPKPCGQGTDRLCTLWENCGLDVDCISNLCSLGMNLCVSARSCTGAPGADDKCGVGEDCCASDPVPGGSFTNVDDTPTGRAASVPPFRMDRFEITVGRFRTFLKESDGNLRDNAPPPGSGAKNTVPGSGWRASFNARLPASYQEANDRYTWGCSVGGNNLDYGAATWTVDPGPNENKPINCIDWYSLFAFCAWDGGRLPSDVEWSYVALAGPQKWLYPFGNEIPTWEPFKDRIDSRLPQAPGDAGTFLFTQGPEYRAADDGPLPIAPVGLKTERSPWGQADMTGNVIEQTMEEARGLVDNCNDCASVAWPDPPQTSGLPESWKLPGGEFSDQAAANDGIRLARGSSWQGEPGGHWLKNGRNRFWLPVWRTYSAMGGRCAR